MGEASKAAVSPDGSPDRSGPAFDDYEGQDLEALADIPNYQQWTVRSFERRIRGRVLEVGAGVGTIARLYAHGARELVLLEPARNLAPQLCENMRPFPNTTVVHARLGDVIGRRVNGCDFSRGSFDVAVMVNVLEHIEDDAGVLRELHDLLRDGGTLVVFVPALGWLFGSLDALVEHKRRYSLETLRDVVRGARFEIETLRYFDVLGVLPWFVAGRIMRVPKFNARAARFYDRVGVPITAAVERFVAPPMGKNLYCIARKG
jgi:SAM-dependent methyltransferase